MICNLVSCFVNFIQGTDIAITMQFHVKFEKHLFTLILLLTLIYHFKIFLHKYHTLKSILIQNELKE